MTKKDKKRNNISKNVGPKPLAYNISAAVKYYAELYNMSFSEEDLKQFWEAPDSEPLFCGMEKMMSGIRKYQLYKETLEKPDLPIVLKIGETKLHYCAAKEESLSKKTALFIVPSLINDSSILDLMVSRSFVRWMASQGVDVYIIEWGNLLTDPDLLTLESILSEKLLPMLDFLQEKYAGCVHGLGYCMGGVLLTALAQLSSKNAKIKCRSLIFVASPWDFHDEPPSLSYSIRAWAGELLPLLMHSDYLPVGWLQTIFASIDPSQAPKKFSAFADMEEGSEAELLFVLVERWLNSGGDLPSSVAVSCIKEWYQENRPYNKKWKVMEEIIDPVNIKEPSFVVVSKKDKIVPPKSAIALYNQLQNATLHEADCGHIGMMVGTNAKKLMWEPVKQWICSHSQ